MAGIIWIKALKLTAIDYFRNTSLTGFKLLFFLDNSKTLQIIWIPFLLTGLLAAVYISGHCILFFQLSPTVTFINTLEKPVAEVPFPAVSICSVNKISEQAVREFLNNMTTIVSTWTRGRQSETDLLKRIDLFGGFYDVTGFDIDEAYEMQTILDKLDPSNAGFFNVTDVLRKLAPKCEHMIRKCSWKGKIYPCEELFQPQVTTEGFCCLFNYNRPGRQEKNISIEYLERAGRDVGLKVLLNASIDDYFFTQRSTLGFVIQIFNSLFFPDTVTGKTSEFTVSPGIEVEAAITTTSYTAEEELRGYQIGQRRCYFADEFPDEYGSYYSQPECLLRCKLRSIKSLCNCIPYYTPGDLIDWSHPVMYCTLSHLECLSRYKMTWTLYRPEGNITGLEQEMEDALSCSGCVILCYTKEYEYQLDKNFLENEAPFVYDEFLNNETNLQDISLLRVFHETPYVMQYKKRLVYTANGLLANVGGILGISIGCSLMSVIEIIYFATFKFYVNLKKLRMIQAREDQEQEMKPRKKGWM